jgi:hypothetical protein
LYERYRDRAEFLAVYVREAHPTDGWRMSFNDHFGVAIAQPRTFLDRVAAGKTCNEKLEVRMPLLVDTIDDRVGRAYSGVPDRLYVLDPDGTVVYKSGRGPFGFKPGEMEQALILTLLDRSWSRADAAAR